jgi:CHAT domain-containing protein
LNHLGLTWQALGDSKSAIKAWQEGQDALRYIISIEPEVQILAGLNAQITRRLVSAHLQQNNAAAALSALERGRAIRLRAELVRARYVLNEDQDDQLVRDYRKLAEIAAERRLLFYDYVSNRRRLDQQMAELVKEYEEISKKIITAESAHPDASLSADQIKAHVEEHQITLIVLCPLDETDGDPGATLALIVTPKKGLSCHKLPLTRQQLHKLIFDKDGTSPGWLPAYQASFAGDEQIWQDTIDRVLGALGKSLLAPLHDVLVRELNVAEGSAVVIVPCEHLSLLPLHAAPVKDDGPCFGDVFVVSYAPSATMLFARAGKQQADAQTDSQFVAVVNPDGSLIFAEGEVEKIPTNLAGKRVVAYGADARLEWLLDKATQADYLHLSTHGDFASGWPERSALLLAHPEGYTEPLRQAGLKGAHLSRAELQDGCEALTLNDLWAYRLKVKPGCLVVLSACETGQIEPGDMIDEALGFPTALLAAGARGVVASLWAVDDFSTSLLMQKMYEEVASGKPPAAAMQVASKYLRNLKPDQIHKEVEGQIQKLEKDYKSGRWKELGLSDQARMFYRITTLKIIFQRTQNCNLTFSKSYYWAPFLYYHLL